MVRCNFISVTFNAPFGQSEGENGHIKTGKSRSNDSPPYLNTLLFVLGDLMQKKDITIKYK